MNNVNHKQTSQMNMTMSNAHMQMSKSKCKAIKMVVIKTTFFQNF